MSLMKKGLICIRSIKEMNSGFSVHKWKNSYSHGKYETKEANHLAQNPLQYSDSSRCKMCVKQPTAKEEPQCKGADELVPNLVGPCCLDSVICFTISILSQNYWQKEERKNGFNILVKFLKGFQNFKKKTFFCYWRFLSFLGS